MLIGNEDSSVCTALTILISIILLFFILIIMLLHAYCMYSIHGRRTATNGMSQSLMHIHSST